MNPDPSILRRRRLRRLRTLCQHISDFTDEFGGESMLVLAHPPVIAPPDDPAQQRKSRNSTKGLVVKFTQANPRPDIQPAALPEFWKTVERSWARHLHAHDLGRFVKSRRLSIARIGDEETDGDDDDDAIGNAGGMNHVAADNGEEDGANNDDDDNEDVFHSDDDGEDDLTPDFLARRIREIHEESVRAAAATAAAGKAKSIFPPIRGKRKRG